MRKILLSFTALIMMSACAEVELASHIAKQVPMPEAQQKSKGSYKVGSPYKIAGSWYKPKAQYEFEQTGTASWYGPNFHGKKTANGEIFNQNDMTAAHRTLQMPSIVRVTNVENGRSAVVRINDRGPFSKGRVIDLSKRAAQELGFINQGTARVKIEVLGDESRRVAEMARNGQSTRGTELALNDLRKPSKTPLPSIKPSVQPYAKAQYASWDPHSGNIPGGVFVQAGAFGSEQTAQTLAGALSGYGPSNVHNAAVNGKKLYRVRLGPFPTERQAQMVLAQINNSGKAQAFLVTD